MIKHRIDSFKKGWFIGDFEPSLIKTQAVEVAVKSYASGDCEASHFHKIATEYTIVLDGSIVMNGIDFEPGDIIEVKPLESTDFKARSECRCLVVKIPGAINDKYFKEQ